MSIRHLEDGDTSCQALAHLLGPGRVQGTMDKGGVCPFCGRRYVVVGPKSRCGTRKSGRGFEGRPDLKGGDDCSQNGKYFLAHGVSKQ